MAKSRQTEYDELRKLVRHCCQIAESADGGALEALKRINRLIADFQAHRRETNSKLESIRLQLFSLLKRTPRTPGV